MDGNWESELFFFTIQFLLDACNFKLKTVTPLKFALLVKNTKYLAKTILHSVDFFSFTPYGSTLIAFRRQSKMTLLRLKTGLFVPMNYAGDYKKGYAIGLV